MFNWKQLQDENKAWVDHNFGRHGKAHRPLLGMIEEVGEIAEAIDKWDVPEILDGIADVAIFAADYCTERDIVLSALVPYERSLHDRAPTIDLEAGCTELFRLLSKIAHHQLKSEQAIRGTTLTHLEAIECNLMSMLTELDCLARHFGKTLLEVVEPVWARVKLRDYKKSPTDGGR